MYNHNPNRRGNECPHAVIEPIIVNYFLTRLACESCGEIIGEWIDTEAQKKRRIEGLVPKLTEEDQEKLR